jgi:hypothetical protein
MSPEPAKGCAVQHVRVRRLGFAVIGVALVGAAPAAVHAFTGWDRPDSPGPAPWAHLLFALAVLQLAYAVLWILVPDRSAAWTVSLYSLALAAGYAMVFGMGLLAQTPTPWLDRLGLGDEAAQSRATAWCLAMLCLNAGVAFFAGRMSLRWHPPSRTQVPSSSPVHRHRAAGPQPKRCCRTGQESTRIGISPEDD